MAKEHRLDVHVFFSQLLALPFLLKLREVGNEDSDTFHA
jgi:hypothetical protein